MNRELEKLLKEKWFLVAADLIVVIAILVAMPEKRDAGMNFIIMLAILLASLIVVIPVLTDGGSKAERLAEQARLRAALAEEIDLLRDGLRTGTEAVNRRMVEVEATAQKVAEANAAAVAQRASTEINALKSALAEIQKKLNDLATADDSAAVDELAAKVTELALTVRSVVADADEAVESAIKTRQEGLEALEAGLKGMRDDLKKAAKQVEKQVDKNAEALEALRAQVGQLSAGVSPAPASEALLALEADEETEADEEPEADEEIVEPAPLEPAPEPTAAAFSAEASGAGTALIINLMIGIGNKPFVRGTGPGLSKDKGVPMSFLGIGRWQWICPQAEASATVEIWKNDQSPLGEPLHLSGGEPVELDESHFSGA